MARASIAEQWLNHPEDNHAAAHEDDGTGYINAATVALMYSSVQVGHSDVLQPADTQSVTPRALRDTMGCFVTGVCVITTTWEGEDVAMTANSVTSVSLDPPLILVCIAKSAKFHEAVLASGVWGVSVLDASAHEISTDFARPGRPRQGQFERTFHHRGTATGVVLVDSSVARIECRTEAVHEAGDHDIVVGRVMALSHTGEAAHPLIYHHGKYQWLP